MSSLDVQAHVRKHYDDFAAENRAAILESDEPEYWSTADEMYEHLRQRVGSQMALVDHYFDRSLPVLDLGCGYGRQAIPLARRGYRVEAVDLSPGLLDVARDLAAKYQVTITFREVNLVTDRYSDRTDWRQVCLFDVIEHMPPEHRVEVIRRITEVMAPGGVLLISLPSRELDSLSVRVAHRLLRMIVTKSRLEGKEHPYIFPTRAEMERMVSSAFEAVEWFVRARTLFLVLRRRG